MKEAVKALYIGYAIFVIILVAWIFVSHRKEVQKAKNIENFADADKGSVNIVPATLFRDYNDNNNVGTGEFIRLYVKDDGTPKKYTFDEIKSLYFTSYPKNIEYDPVKGKKALEMKAIRITTGYQVLIMEEGTTFKKPTFTGPYMGQYNPQGWPTIYLKQNTVLIVRKVPTPPPVVIPPADNSAAAKQKAAAIMKTRDAQLQAAALRPPPIDPVTNTITVKYNQMHYPTENELIQQDPKEISNDYWKYDPATNRFTANVDSKIVMTPVKDINTNANDKPLQYLIYVNETTTPVASGLAIPKLEQQDSLEFYVKAGDVFSIKSKTTDNVSIQSYIFKIEINTSQPEYPIDMPEVFQKYTMKTGYNNKGVVIQPVLNNVSIQDAKQKCRENSACVGFTYLESAQRAELLSKMGNDTPSFGYRVYQKST